jgi:hypothetical protein
VPAVETVQRVMGGRPQNSGRQAIDRSQGPSTVRASEEQADLGGSSGGDDYNARAVRHSIRVFVATGAAMKLWSLLSSRLMARKQE